jgi:hypothetical protein
LFWYAKSENMDRAMDYNLRDCIECRCCDIVCPSHIPLAQYLFFFFSCHHLRTLCLITLNSKLLKFKSLSSNICLLLLFLGKTKVTRAVASRVHPFCNLQSRARTHAVLVIGLCELPGNPTT